MVDALPGHDFAAFMIDGNNVFSDYNVDGYSFFEGVYLIGANSAVVPTTPTVDPPAVVIPTPTTVNNLDNQVFKIKLLNNGQFFNKASGAEFRA